MFLHWLTAGLILLNWLLPQLTDLLARSNAPRLLALHRSIGITVLALVLLRAVWRIVSPPPDLPSGTAQLIRLFAHINHLALYLLMLAVPVLGILFTWASGHALSLWGLAELRSPGWVSPDLHDRFRALHAFCANAMLWVVGVHAAAALVHHYIFRDGLLDRMLPARLRTRRRRRGALI